MKKIYHIFQGGSVAEWPVTDSLYKYKETVNKPKWIWVKIGLKNKREIDVELKNGRDTFNDKGTGTISETLRKYVNNIHGKTT